MESLTSLQTELHNFLLFLQMILLVVFFTGFPLFLLVLWLGEWARKKAFSMEQGKR